MDNTKVYTILTIVFTCMLTSCVSTGMLNGRLSVPGQPAAPVTFNFKSDRSGEGGKLSAMLPDGEFFSGRYLQITSTINENAVAPMFQPWDPYWNSWGPFGSPWYGDGTYSAFRTNYSGKVIATLFGDKGSTMRCRFRLSDPPSGLSGGGTGECQLSTGGTIQVQF
jgi:hypothetical protein